MRRGQFDGERAKGLSEPIAPPRSDQRDDVVALRGYPGDRDLCRGCIEFAGDYAQRFDQGQVCIEIAARRIAGLRGENPSSPSGLSTNAR